MFCCCRKEYEILHENKQSMNQNKIKVLLLGSGEGGKSTFMR